ncbi:putative methionine--tRNA ligase [Vitis vinifera]|uniref:Putative methionine--tRNA ligase n=1 Tax=Vitis vinifera TaxID=29760 RepID=A0A438J2P6_VITVI|nr:putative methionine--tRNA ligase [Vitis vinifera]
MGNVIRVADNGLHHRWPIEILYKAALSETERHFRKKSERKMATGDAAANVVLRRKQSIVSSLCKHLSLDPKIFLDSIVENDIKSLCTNILKTSGSAPKNSDEVSKWISFAESYPVDSKACFGALHVINEELAEKSVLVGDGLKPSEADVIVFSLLHPFVIGLPNTERQKLPHLVRWMEYIQSKENFGELFPKILLENDVIELPVEDGSNRKEEFAFTSVDVILYWLNTDSARMFKCKVAEAFFIAIKKPKIVVKVEADPNAKKTVQSTKNADNTEANPNSKKSNVAVPFIFLNSLGFRWRYPFFNNSPVDKNLGLYKDPRFLEALCRSSSKFFSTVIFLHNDIALLFFWNFKKKVTGNNAAAEEKKKLPEKEAVEKDKEVSISLLNIQVGLIRKAWKHPSADSLLVEEIDVGDAKLRQVVSGLAKYCSPEELTNRRVVLITNVKPGKLRDVMSEGLVLCASNEDHTGVEPLLPPEGAKIGERVSFSGNEGKPEDVLNPKKKQLEKITPHLFTDDKGVATFKGIPFMTSGGPCTCSIPKASIK